jgi:Flp pilus assembly protein CpaB
MKNKFPLIIAIVIGIAALFAIKQYVAKMQQQAANQLRGDMVVAANMDIPAGVELTVQMLAPKEVPKQFIPAQAIQGSESVKQILGTKTRVAIHAGQLVLWSDLVSEAKSGLSSIIPEDEGAFSVGISKGVKSDLIQPSDHIDIIGSFAIPKSQEAAPSGATPWRQPPSVVNIVLLQNVTVLAVGENFTGSAKASNEGTSDLTLALTLAEAQELMFAQQNGELGAVLRREGSTSVVPRNELPRITFEKIDDIIGDLDGRRNFHSIEVQKGSQSTSVPVSNQK